jgi:hypothetical protein
MIWHRIVIDVPRMIWHRIVIDVALARLGQPVLTDREHYLLRMHSGLPDATCAQMVVSLREQHGVERFYGEGRGPEDEEEFRRSQSFPRAPRRVKPRRKPSGPQKIRLPRF